jgi:hypothetical protein
MSESENASVSPEDIWDYIKDNPKIIGMPITEHKGLDLLSALRDIYQVSQKDLEMAQRMLTMLAYLLVAVSQGEGEELVEEVLIQGAMIDFEKEIGKILDEGR